ncbi:ABC transporter ATP-binding protein [uncultured Paenalcaligenes sp.]|uniref:ABC transporter ATP-binding protein n=1 Tax=uncultured Paenalcaligenes sp. TaxID=1588925 RepID=UPI002629E347|nr:oligopeptide/dipeptide ABC transporter ATP-binding protein [uncultured Paenalcaligenes sp.]
MDNVIELKQLGRDFSPDEDVFSRFIRRLSGQKPLASVHAVSQVDLQLRTGETLGIVGESGCGKSTLGRMVAGILNPSHGQIFYNGQLITELSARARKEYELRVQMIFQDPFSSLNPRMRVLDSIGEAAVVHGLIRQADLEDFVIGLMQKVGLDPSTRFRYPHQFSGGQRQRIGIARALALNPSVIVCDEAVAALDVSIQAQVLNLFKALQSEFTLSYLFISHNLGVVSHIADRVAIMYLGRVVEIADVETIFSHAQHPYTQALLKELPQLRAEKRDFIPIQGELPSPLDPPSGCAFHPRCVHAFDRCRLEQPVLQVVDTNMNIEHRSACHLIDNKTHL